MNGTNRRCRDFDGQNVWTQHDCHGNMGPGRPGGEVKSSEAAIVVSSVDDVPLCDTYLCTYRSYSSPVNCAGRTKVRHRRTG